MDKEVILNVAAGKIDKIETEKPTFLVNVDTMYYDVSPPEIIENVYKKWNRNQTANSVRLYSDTSIFEFMERTKLRFDIVKCFRFLEHVERDKILYFIYLLSSVTKVGGYVDVIVPNYRLLAKMLLHEDPYDKNFEKQNIILSTEMLNEKADPHCSVWTIERAKYFFELEGRFKIRDDYDTNHKFDGRDIYLRFKAERI